MTRAARSLAAVVAVLSVCAVARAQGEPDPGETPPAPVLTPPSLIEGVEGVLPEGTLGEGESREVGLLILISPEGTAAEVEVIEGQGQGEPFDAAAIEAASRFTFEPATRDGAPIPARIRFRFVFRGPEPPPPPPPTGGLELEVRAGGEALAGALVLVFALDEDGEDVGEALRTRTDATGRVGFDELSPGARRVIVSAEGFETLERREDVVADEALELRYTLVREVPAEEDAAPAAELPELGVTAVVERPRREATRRTLPREVLTRMPGTRGDALRVVELLPGVARPSFGSGALRVRGAAPGDSEVFVDGVSVPLLYHFGGLTSFYNSRLLERIDFYPGNFSVRYGRRIGGILEVEPRDPSDDRNFHGVLDINLIDGSLLIETPLWEGASIALAARRSYVDFFFAEVIPDDVFDVIAAPVYYDYQLVFTWRPGRDDRLRLLVYGSSDEFRTIFNGDDFARPFGLELTTQFHRVQASWRHDYDEEFRQDVTFAGGWTGLVIQAGEAFGFNAEFVPLTFRSEWTLALHEDVQVRWGIDWQFTPTSLAFRGPAPQQSEGMPGGADPNAPQAAASFSGSAYRPAIYAESSLRPVDPLTLVLGLRLDYFRDIDAWTFDPRLSGRVALTDQWTIKAGIGLFSQPPEFQESAEGLGNPNLQPITAVHSSAGVELRYDRTWRFEIEGYYKHIWQRVVGTEGGVPPFFDNEGVGRIYGAELSIRAEPTPSYPIFGFLSYTLSRSERMDRGGDWRLFDFDQTHILSLAVVWRIGDGWEAGGTFRLVSGNPFTPVNGSLYDVTAGSYRPIYGATNSARGDFFHRLDLRLEKVFNIENVARFAIYLDVQNVYNATNPEATTYSYDYANSAVIPGLPILPSLGIRGEL